MILWWGRPARSRPSRRQSRPMGDAAHQPEHFPEKWIPVFRRKCDQIENLEPGFDSIKAGKALVNQAGTGRLFERSRKRSILVTTGAADRRDPGQMILRLVAIAL